MSNGPKTPRPLHVPAVCCSASFGVYSARVPTSAILSASSSGANSTYEDTNANPIGVRTWAIKSSNASGST